MKFNILSKLQIREIAVLAQQMEGFLLSVPQAFEECVDQDDLDHLTRILAEYMDDMQDYIPYLHCRYTRLIDRDNPTGAEKAKSEP